MKHKHRFNLLAAGLLTSVLSTGCAAAIQETAAPSAPVSPDGNTNISLEDGDVLIESSGVYELTGSQENGSVIVNVNKETDQGTVYLVLNGVTLNSEASAPIYIKEAEHVEIVLKDGTVNTITQGSQVTVDESGDPNAAVFSKADLTIGGTGSLSVTAEFNDGITSKDDLVITGGTINVEAAGDGIVGKDLLSVDAALITVMAGKDGMRSTNAEEADKGNVVINSGQIIISAEDDGIHSENGLTVNEGEITIEKSYEGLEGKEMTIQGGNISVAADNDGINVSSQTGTFTINGGDLAVKSGGDGLDSNGNIVQNGGSIIIDTSTVGSMDTPVDYDGTFTQSGGTITDQNGNEIDTEQGAGGRGGGGKQLPPEGEAGTGERPQRGGMKNGNQGV